MWIPFLSRKPANPNANLAYCVVNIPTLVDTFDSKELRALSKTSRDLNTAVSHPAVWRNQFAKEVGARPRDLPAAPGTFKALCHGLKLARTRANNPNAFILDTQGALIRETEQYLEQHFPEIKNLLRAIADEIAQLEAQGNLPAGFRDDLIKGTTMTGGSAATVAYNAWQATRVKAMVACPKTWKIIKLVKLLGPKGAKVYLYSFLGVTSAPPLYGAYVGAVLTSSVIIHGCQHYTHRRNALRDLRIKDLVDARRAEVDGE